VVAPAPETYDVRYTSEGTKNARGHCYKTEISRCLDTSEANPDSNHGGIAVVEKDPAYALQGSMIGRKDKNGPQGDGVNEEVSFTLNTSDRHAVAFAQNQRGEVRDLEDKAGSLSAQPGMQQQTFVAEEDGVWCATTGSFMTVEKEKSHTLMARDYKDPQIVNDIPNDELVYIVRRLTPVECARLQGFPDWWCADLAIPDPSDEELDFWKEVWETWRKTTNPDGKPKTEKQIRKWLADPYTDAAEYKLWGNGIFVGNAYFVLAGIEWAANSDNKETESSGEA